MLVVDDSPIYRRLISDNLRRWGFEVVLANNGLEGWKILEQPNSPTLVITDWVMPSMNGVDLCRKVRERGASEAYVYMILLTSKDDKSDLLNAMEAGADDYLTKPFDDQELRVRLLVGERISALQRELIAARESMRRAATYDSLTELLNRREIMDCLRRELVRCAREKNPVGIIMADIDHFKQVNDRYGHAVGDEAIIAVADACTNGKRQPDIVGRLGGEEFAILLPETDLAQATIVADRLCTSIAEHELVAHKVHFKVTASIGIAAASASMSGLDVLMRAADQALYRAKAQGRNCTVQWSPPPAPKLAAE